MLSHHKLGQNKELWNGFSIFDVNDLRQKYPPLSDPKIEFVCEPKAKGTAGNWMDFGTTYRITANYTNPTVKNPEYSFRISRKDQHAVCQLTPLEQNGFNLTFSAYGECEVTTDISKNGTVVNSYTNTYYGVADWFTYPASPQIGTISKWDYWTPEVTESELVISVSEEYFQDKVPVTVESVSGEKNRVRIHFNDYGSYTALAELRAQGRKIASKTYHFTKLYRPSSRINIDQYVAGSYQLPSYPTTEPTGHHPLNTMKCSIDFGAEPVLGGRLICDVHMQYIQNALYFRRVDHQVIDGPSVRLLVNIGDSSHRPLPDLYEMYHPDSLNYAGHTNLVLQYYTDVSYPAADRVWVK